MGAPEKCTCSASWTLDPNAKFEHICDYCKAYIKTFSDSITVQECEDCADKDKRIAELEDDLHRENIARVNYEESVGLLRPQVARLEAALKEAVELLEEWLRIGEPLRGYSLLERQRLWFETKSCLERKGGGDG